MNNDSYFIKVNRSEISNVNNSLEKICLACSKECQNCEINNIKDFFKDIKEQGSKLIASYDDSYIKEIVDSYKLGYELSYDSTGIMLTNGKYEIDIIIYPDPETNYTYNYHYLKACGDENGYFPCTISYMETKMIVDIIEFLKNNNDSMEVECVEKTE